jgi:hypothetical protein
LSGKAQKPAQHGQHNWFCSLPKHGANATQVARRNEREAMGNATAWAGENDANTTFYANGNGTRTFTLDGGTYGLLLTAATVRYLKTKSVPVAAVVPIVFVPIFLAYQADFAYGNKAERIKRMRDEITKEKHWFVPLTVDHVKDK